MKSNLKAILPIGVVRAVFGFTNRQASEGDRGARAASEEHRAPHRALRRRVPARRRRTRSARGAAAPSRSRTGTRPPAGGVGAREN